jgi:hypothetical protein
MGSKIGAARIEKGAGPRKPHLWITSGGGAGIM